MQGPPKQLASYHSTTRRHNLENLDLIFTAVITPHLATQTEGVRRRTFGPKKHKVGGGEVGANYITNYFISRLVGRAVRTGEIRTAYKVLARKS
jgi:hypothetical protein